MENFKNQSYVIMEFATVDSFYDKIKKRVVNLAKDEIIEVSAVKIENGKIKEYFNSFISIDGYDAHNIEFEGFRQLSYYADSLHLIGAPNFGNIAERLFHFIGQSIIINMVFTSNEAFKIFKEKAQSFGYVFNNSTISIDDIYTAKRLKDMIEEGSEKFENLKILQLAQLLKTDKNIWTEIFADNDIFFDPDSEVNELKGRNDPLSWALAFARFFIKLSDCEEDVTDIDESIFEEIKDIDNNMNML